MRSRSPDGRTTTVFTTFTMWFARNIVMGVLLPGFVLADELPNVRRTEDVIYGRKDGLALTMDVFQPKNANRCGIVNLVNGAWLSSNFFPPTDFLNYGGKGICGVADEVVPLQQSESFMARAKEAGITDLELVVRHGKKHGWPEGSIVWKSEEDVGDLIRWFDAHLNHSEVPKPQDMPRAQ